MLANLLVALVVSLVAMFVVALCRAARRADDQTAAWAKRRALMLVNKQG